jgi:aminoglycoside phosphotransferase (APT) family kinase protein
MTQFAGEQDDISVEFIESYFQEKLGGTISIKSLEKFPRGVSRETWFITALEEEANNQVERKYILRRDLPAGSICPSDLRTEYEVYKRLDGSGVPVAETLWYVDDLSRLGSFRPFYIRRHVEGSWSIPGFEDPDPKYNNLRIEVGREHVRKLALIHAADWKSLGFADVFAAPSCPDESASFLIKRIVQKIDELKMLPLPLVADAAGWFLQNIPVPTDKICLVKGTNGLGEEVFNGTEIVAMADWELACIGDPAMDFALAQNFLSDVHDSAGKRLWGLPEALEYYLEITGVKISMETVEFYKKLYGFYRVEYAQSALRQMSMDKLCRMPWIAIEVMHLGQKALATAIGCPNLDLPDMGQRG